MLRPLFVSLLSAVLLLGVGPTPTVAADGKFPEVQAPQEVKPGQEALVKSSAKLSYYLRVPRTYHPKHGAPLLVFMHGSNMNGNQYLQTFKSRGWAKEYILLCPNGELGNDPYGRNNFTQSSARFVAEVTKEVQKGFQIGRTYVGGHSQGGFLTYSVFMLYPDLYQGALPMAGDCWMQNEPNLWQDRPDTMTKQKKIAIAVIHGKNDSVVNFSQGQHAYDVFLVMGYPKIRFFTPARSGHMFGMYPVAEALEWLDAMNGINPKQSVSLANRWAGGHEWGWTVQVAAAMGEGPKPSKAHLRKAVGMVKKAEKVCSKQIKGMTKMMATRPAKEWLPVFWEFRHQFGATKSAAPIIKRFEEQRSKQRQLGSRLFQEARSLRQSDPEGYRQRLGKILEEAPASFHAYYAWKWLGYDKDDGSKKK